MGIFGFFGFIFQQLLYRPFLNLLVFLYNLPLIDFGGAIVLLTLLTKAITWRLDTHAIVKQREAQIKGAEVQEEMKKIQEKYKDEPVKQQEEIMKLWKEKKFNPFSSFVPLIVQIIIIIAIFQVLKNGIRAEQLNMLYSFVKNPGVIIPSFLRIPLNALNLSKPNLILAILTGGVQFIYSKITFTLQKKHTPKKKKGKEKKEESGMQKMLQNQMIYFLPLMLIFFYAKFLPSAVALYWFIATIIGTIQIKIIYKKLAEEKR